MMFLGGTVLILGGWIAVSAAWLGALGFVDWVFFRRLSKCPIVVASKDGGYFLSVRSDSPGRSGRYRLLMAVSSVVMAGDQSAA